MSRMPDLAERIERLLVRYGEMQRTHTLLTQQLQAAHAERDSLKSRLAAARARIDALLGQLPANAPEPELAPVPAPASQGGLGDDAP